jgi:integrase
LGSTSPNAARAWQEIDWDALLWTVPAKHMKRSVPHVVPLADRATEILRTPGVGVGGLTFTRLLGRVGLRSRTAAHGFRTSFRIWAAETNQCRGGGRAALAHVIKNKVEAAYGRTCYLEERTTFLWRWAFHCS